MTSQRKTVIIIAGPTAVGKTAVGIAVARHFNTEIVSADSRQCFKELDIGVARPSPQELAAVPHHFIASHSIYEKVTAATFEQYALKKVNDIFERRQYAIMVGGTGLYINAFTNGMDEIPEVPGEVHRQVVESYHLKGLPWLQAEVMRKDPLFLEKGESQNPQRLMRALEVVNATGQSILSYQSGQRKERSFDIIKIALELPREGLYQRINHRVEVMMQRGLLIEAKAFYPYRLLNALQTVGYKELFDYLDDACSLSQAVETIQRNTRHYAKRQLTWFRKDKEYTWLPSGAEAVVDFLTKEKGCQPTA